MNLVLHSTVLPMHARTPAQTLGVRVHAYARVCVCVIVRSSAAIMLQAVGIVPASAPQHVAM